MNPANWLFMSPQEVSYQIAMETYYAALGDYFYLFYVLMIMVITSVGRGPFAGLLSGILQFSLFIIAGYYNAIPINILSIPTIMIAAVLMLLAIMWRYKVVV